MGNDQSRSAKGGEEANDGPIDYYELLKVDVEATPDEIKKSYRKLALIHHPDKNAHRVEEATKMFADLQQAYEILSDPNERAFYDRHRNDHIETNDDDFYDHVRAGDAAATDPKSKFNRRRAGDPGVKIDQLMRFFDPKLARKMDDSNEGFYSVYRTLFNVLASDEALHTPEGQTFVHYPPFGDSTTPYAPPPGMTKAEKSKTWWARDFYVAWGEFATEKRFEWLEKWDTARGEDRNIRRLMEKENKKLREDHRKEYIDTVRTLVQFIQHRDPRYKAYQVQIAQAKKAKKAEGLPGSGTSTPGRGTPRTVDVEAAKKREEERRKAAAAFQEQDWQRFSKRPDDDEEEEQEPIDQGDGTGIRMDDGAGGEIFECVACNKTFQSEASWGNHERSKKHKQAVFRMAKEMRAETIAFSDDDFVTPQEADFDEDEEADFDEDELIADLEELELDELEEMEALEAEQASLEDAIRKTTEAAPDAPPPTKPKKTKSPEPAAAPEHDEDEDDTQSTTTAATVAKVPELSKREKRRAREAVKKAEEEAAKLAAKESRKEAKKVAKGGVPPPAPAPSKGKNFENAFVQPKTKGKKGAKGGKQPEKVVVTAKDVERAVEDIQALRQKMVDKWGQDWTDLVSRVACLFAGPGATTAPDLAVLCLGLGKPFGDRTAKIQLALILELTVGLGAPISVIETFDPVFEDGDRQVLEALGCTVIQENLRGEHTVHETRPHLIYMPHCSKTLYESFFHTNYTKRLGASPPVILLGNDLGDYLPGFVRAPPPGAEAEQPAEDEFVKPKKKRKGRGPAERQFEDTVLRRLVPHFDTFMLSDLPETNLPGFARAFLSTAFQWLPEENVAQVDWETPLPEVEWPDDGEVA